MVNPSDYPLNYDWLPKEKQEAILKVLNKQQRKLDSKYQEFCDTYKPCFEDRIACQRDLFNKYIAPMTTILDAMDIQVRYNWAGDRNQWILVDYDRAELELDWEWQCRD